jgi:hypothetical protein
MGDTSFSLISGSVVCTLHVLFARINRQNIVKDNAPKGTGDHSRPLLHGSDIADTQENFHGCLVKSE